MNIWRSLTEPVTTALRFFPVTALLGPRQCGKTTLAKVCIAGRPGALYLDLERPSDAAKPTDAEAFLRGHQEHLVCLDEIGRAPDLFAILRSLCDETKTPGRFLVLGSASPALLRQRSETLAGRIGYLELTPFTEAEVGSERQELLWLRGGFPRSYLAPSDGTSRLWLESFILTFLERDLPQLGIRVPGTTVRRFWEMCAHLHGDLWNHEKVASSLGVSGKTVGHYLAILEQAYMLRRLQPFSTNAKKRLVKAPCVYRRDSGLLHRLLRTETLDGSSGHPVRGASWEGYVVEQVAAAVPEAQLSFYRTAAGAEIDLLVQQGQRLTAIEIKATSAPRLERGFWSAMEDLEPSRAWVAAQVTESYPLGHGVAAAPLAAICQALRSA